jgi:hypothetical protein
LSLPKKTTIMAKPTIAKKTKPLSKSEILNAITDVIGKEVSKKHVKDVFDALVSVGHKDLKKNGLFALAGLRKVRCGEEAGASRSEGYQPVHEAGADTRREACEQDCAGTPREGHQGRDRLSASTRMARSDGPVGRRALLTLLGQHLLREPFCENAGHFLPVHLQLGSDGFRPEVRRLLHEGHDGRERPCDVSWGTSGEASALSLGGRLRRRRCARGLPRSTRATLRRLIRRGASRGSSRGPRGTPALGEDVLQAGPSDRFQDVGGEHCGEGFDLSSEGVGHGAPSS